MLCLHADTDEDRHALEDEDESGMSLCTCWRKVFIVAHRGRSNHCHETTLEYVQNPLDDIQWESGKREFDDMMATKTESAPDGFPRSIFQCAGRLGSQFLFDAF